MKITAFRHVPGEPLGYFEKVFSESCIPFEYHDLFETNEIAPVDATHLIFLGGPMSVNDEDEYPWLKQEKELIRRSRRRKQKVLGICLGARAHCVSLRCERPPVCAGKRLAFPPEGGWYRRGIRAVPCYIPCLPVSMARPLKSPVEGSSLPQGMSSGTRHSG